MDLICYLPSYSYETDALLASRRFNNGRTLCELQLSVQLNRLTSPTPIPDIHRSFGYACLGGDSST